MKKSFTRNIVAAALTLVAVFSFATVVSAEKFGDTCCVYYDDTYNEEDANCQVMNIQEKTVSETFSIFSCSAYDSTPSDGCPDGEVKYSEDSQCLNEGELVFPTELGAGIIKDESVEACPTLKDYKLKTLSAEHAHCTVGNLLLFNTFKGKNIATLYEKELQKPIDAEKEKVLKGLIAIKKEVDAVQKNTCCIPLTPTYKTRCFAPNYTKYGGDMFGFISNPNQKLPIASLYTDPRLSAQGGASPSEDTPKNAYYYLTCGQYSDTTAIKYSCNTNQKFAPPEWAGGGGGVEVPLKHYCTIPDPTLYCVCPTDGGKCAPLAYSAYTGSDKDKKGDHYCTEAIKNKPGFECLPTSAKPGCQKWELICDYSDGVAKDCHCPNAGKEVTTEDCNNVKSRDLRNKEVYDGIPLNIGEIHDLTRGLKKTRAENFQELAGLMLKALMGIVGSIALALFVYGGIMVMSAAGNDERLKKGTQILVWSALGVIIILAAYALVDFVFEIFK